MDRVSSAQFDVVDGTPRVGGDLDLATAAEFERFLDQLGSRPVTVDFSGVTFFDSTALRVLLRSEKKNPGLRIVNPSSRVARILEITQTDHLLHDGSLK